MPWCSQTSERQLLVYLRGLGLVQEPEALVVSDPLDRLVADFVEYLVRKRGLAVGSHSVYEYERTARLFLSGRIDPDGVGLERLTAGDVTRFVLAQCRQRSGRMSWALVSSLRGLLRFLFVEGLTPHDLTGAVLGVAKWRGGSLPKALPIDQCGTTVGQLRSDQRGRPAGFRGPNRALPAGVARLRGREA
jgi:site-specific recombinase XerD